MLRFVTSVLVIIWYSRNQPSLYHKGETVLIRVSVSKKLVKGKKNSPKNTCEGVFLEADHSVHKHLISYSDPVTFKSKMVWCKVDDVISVTKEEKDWQQKTKSAQPIMPIPQANQRSE